MTKMNSARRLTRYHKIYEIQVKRSRVNSTSVFKFKDLSRVGENKIMALMTVKDWRHLCWPFQISLVAVNHGLGLRGSRRRVGAVYGRTENGVKWTTDVIGVKVGVGIFFLLTNGGIRSDRGRTDMVENFFLKNESQHGLRIDCR